MQRLRKCLGIDLGSSAVKIVELVAEKDGVQITRMVSAEIPLPPGPMDAARIAEVTKVVKDLLSANKIGTKQAIFAISGQAVFVRRLRMPRTSEDHMHRIVAYEARQQIPFAIDNSMMEYQVFDNGAAREVEVLLVAIKRDYVIDYMKLITKLGLKPVMISVSTLALYNYHIFDSTPFNEILSGVDDIKPKVAKDDGAAKKKGFSIPKFSLGKKKVLDIEDVANAAPVDDFEEPIEIEELPFETDMFEEVKAFINVGASIFDLAIGRFGQRKMLGFSRSPVWGGNELTRILNDKMAMESPEQADLLKRERAIAVIPGREDEAQAPGIDPHASEFVAQWADRLILEIRKSFDFYIAQPDGMTVDNIVLSGGQALQRNLPAYIEEKLGIRVEMRTAPENAALRLAPGQEETLPFSSYLVAIGMGLTGLGYGQITVDFLPSEMKTMREFKKKNMEVAVLLAAILAMVGISTQIGSQEMSNMDRWLAENEGKLASLSQGQKRIQDARAARTNQNERITAIGESMSDRTFWLEFMGMLESVKPASLLIASIQMMPDGTVELTAESEDSSAIPGMISAMKNETTWVKESSISRAPFPVTSQLTGRQVQSFGMRIVTHWKSTRLAQARVTMAPGNFTPTPAPTGAPGAAPGMEFSEEEMMAQGMM